MKFMYNSVLNLVLSGLKISALAVAMVAIVACGSKKDDNKKKKSDNPPGGSIHVGVENDLTSGTKLTSCSLDGQKLPLGKPLPQATNNNDDGDWSGTISAIKDPLSLTCTGDDGKTYHAWYSYSDTTDGTANDHEFAVDDDVSKWGTAMTSDIALTVTHNAKDITTCTVNGQSFTAAFNTQSGGQGDYAWDVTVKLPKVNYGEMLNIDCGAGKKGQATASDNIDLHFSNN